MASYRLLRSNKESGPYSLNDLVTLGLKPYDLVWVDGRSAAWRYPSEVAELKEFAPAVEEQPYDRFYKKPSEPVLATESTVAKQQEISQPQAATERVVAAQPEIIQPVNPIKEKVIIEEPVRNQPEIIQPVNPVREKVVIEEPVKRPVTEIPDYSRQSYQPQPAKKQVFVSMPENNGFNPYQQEAKTNYQEEAYQQYLPKAKPVQQKETPVEKPHQAQKDSYTGQKSYSPIDIHESEDARLETKYTQSLDDIKEMYINTLVQRKTRNRRKEIFRKYVKPALVPLFLVISGIAIGYVITYKKGAPNALQAVSKVVPQQTTPEQQDEEVTDNKTTESKVVPPQEDQNLVVENHKNKNAFHQQQTRILLPKQNRSLQPVPKAVVPERNEKTSYVPDNEIVNYQKKDVQVDPATGERSRTIRDNDEVVTKENNSENNKERLKKKNDPEPNFIEETERRSIRDFVSVKNNNYIRGSFGGIRGLELTVYNRSAFLVDEVNIELQIMKPSEQPLRTDVITVRNISANGAVTIKVPDSQRGIRVDYRITNVESKQWQKSTAGL